MSAAFEPEIADTEELAIVPLAEKVSREGIWMVWCDFDLTGLTGDARAAAIQARHSLAVYAKDAAEAEATYRTLTGHEGPVVVEGVQ